MVHLTPFNFEEEILEATRFCVVKFSNDGCYLCRGLEGIYEDLSNRYSSKIKFATVDIEMNPDLGKIFEIEGVPAIYFFIKGDAEEIPYPEDPSIISGYGEEYLIDFIDSRLNQEER